MSDAQLYARYLLQGWRRRLTRGGPIFVTLFVTSRCNARCGHCFYRRRFELTRGQGELSLTEYRRVAASMAPFSWMLVGGGEPFLRDDLAGILEAFYLRNKVRKFTIPTNGTLPDRVEALTSEILVRCPTARIQIQLSMDGVGQAHDLVRGFPGAFERLMETHQRLRTLQQDQERLDLVFNFTLSSFTLGNIQQVCDHLSGELNTRRLQLVVVRGETYDSEAGQLTPQQCAAAMAQVDRFCLEPEQDRGGGALPALLQRDLDTRRSLTMERIQQSLDGSRRPFRGCHAGVLDMVIDEQGQVFPCEMLSAPAGDLRRCDYDFGHIWRSPEMARIRRHIANQQCRCTHETSVTNSFYFSLSSYYSLLRRFIAQG